MSNEPKVDLAGDDGELVGRLKLIASKLVGRMVVDGVEVNATCDQAADRITALSAEVAVAQDYKDCGCSYDHPDDICLGHMKLFERRHAALSAEVERKDAALQFYAREQSWRSAGMHMCGHAPDSSAVIDRGERARAALGAKP